MASEFYQITGGDEVLLVGPGQAHCRKLDVTTAHNLRIGFFISFCKMDAKDVAYTAGDTDSVSITTADRNIGFLLGVRNYSTSLLGTAGEYFVGLSGVGSPLTLQNSGGNNFNTGATLKPFCFNGASSATGNISVWNITPASGVGASFVGMKFVGVGGNHIATSFQTIGGITDVSQDALKYRIANLTSDWGETNIDSMSGVLPYCTSFFIQNPFVYSGIRIHAYGFMVAA